MKEIRCKDVRPKESKALLERQVRECVAWGGVRGVVKNREEGCSVGVAR